ncbi:MAG TPA: ATP-binding protein [Bacteroidia bacterium]|nr:ATP-binding protein [Bacteroidia bacterium]
MISRIAEKLIRSHARQFRALAVIGPRQSGKTTLVRTVFPNKPYISLENPDERLFATSDPRAFLRRFTHGAILDEAQRVPELFSYLQQILDETKKTGLFILTGSNNFLLQESITQSLAGRIGFIDLLPLSATEINSITSIEHTSGDIILKGCYPELYDKKIRAGVWYPSYIRTYVERDVKLLRNIDNTLLFNRFLQLCAGRIGQQLSVSALSNECGIDVKTVNAWLGVLQSSYIIHLVQPHHRNFNKRVVKTPKLYFIDTGLACSLLGIRETRELENSHFKGALFENLVVMELQKNILNHGSASRLYFWRDNKGVEIDVLIDTGKKLIPVEIKSAQTVQESQLKSLLQWSKFSGITGGYLFYDGQMELTTSTRVKVSNWRKAGELKL